MTASVLGRHLVGALVFILAACSPLPNLTCLNGLDGEEIFVTYQFWHRGIAIPINSDTLAAIPEIQDFPESTYVEIGWGDRDYYTGKRQGVLGGLRALFFSSGSVIHIFGFSRPPQFEFKDIKIKKLTLSREEYLKLTEYLGGQFERANDEKAVPFASGLYGRSAFYEARGKFGVFNNCHHWALKGLIEAGCRY